MKKLSRELFYYWPLLVLYERIFCDIRKFHLYVTFYESMKVVLRLHDDSTEKFKYHVYNNGHR